MEPLGHVAIRFRHLGDLREHVALPVRRVRAPATARCRLHLLGPLLHRSSFLVRESLGLLAGRGGALGGLLRGLLWAHRNLLIMTWVENFCSLDHSAVGCMPLLDSVYPGYEIMIQRPIRFMAVLNFN